MLPDVEFMIFNHFAMRDEEKDGDKNPKTTKNHGSSLWTETKTTDLHFCHFVLKDSFTLFVTFLTFFGTRNLFFFLL